MFRIDDGDYRARVDQAAAAVMQRRAALGILASQVELQRAVIEQAVAAQAAADAEAVRAARDFSRAQRLVASDAVSQSSHDHAEADHLQARARAAEAKANIAAAERRLQVLESHRPQIEAGIAAAEAVLKLAEIDLENTMVRSLANGWVSERRARRGQCARLALGEVVLHGSFAMQSSRCPVKSIRPIPVFGRRWCLRAPSACP
ncbi:MAG: hypothetical protein L0210_11095 [Rhodospirillales bacterium]|nr:hypothetical protein [Rhodospirillales bacterium]